VFNLPQPRYRSNSFKKANKITQTKRNVIHYKRGKKSLPHCPICRQELNGISLSKEGGKSRRTNSRVFGGVLCAKCTSDVITLGSRVERGDMKLNEIGIKQRRYVLQLVAH
jgi:large subunit ribosomal protein L34e